MEIWIYCVWSCVQDSECLTRRCWCGWSTEHTWHSKGLGCFLLPHDFRKKAWHPLFLINTSRKVCVKQTCIWACKAPELWPESQGTLRKRERKQALLYPVPPSLLINKNKAGTNLLPWSLEESHYSQEWVLGKHKDTEPGHGYFLSCSPSSIPVSASLCPSPDFLRELGLDLARPPHRWKK